MKISTIKGQYQRGEVVSLRFESNESLPDHTEFRVKLYHLDSLIYDTVISPCEGIMNVAVPEESIPEGAGGFGCICEAFLDHEIINRCSTAFDFYNSEKPVVRYGFLSDFSSEHIAAADDSLDFLAEFHMSHVQFYDWTFRHHYYEGPADVYRDAMGKKIDLRVVKYEIKGCKDRGMKALGYGAVYAAGKEYLETHPDQALTDAEGFPHNLIEKFYIMDIRHGSEWRKTLIDQYVFAVNKIGFEGIHMDTYGFPKRAFTSDSDDPKLIYLEDYFSDLIDEVRNRLGEKAVLIFNNVGNWPVCATGEACQNAIYIEVWNPHDCYSHIRQIILAATVYKKPVVLAAYLAPFRLEDDHGGRGALNSSLILHSVITSLGASHLLLGEDRKVLTQGYYNDYSTLRIDEFEILRKYYDFQVRYLDIFLDPELIEISETHTEGENREYFFEGAPVSADGRAGTIWIIVRESRRRKVISLINLIGQKDSLWNKVKEDLSPVEHFSITFPDDGEYRSIFAASPDLNDGEAAIINVEKVRNQRGAAMRLRLKNLHLWTMVVVDYPG